LKTLGYYLSPRFGGLSAKRELAFHPLAMVASRVPPLSGFRDLEIRPAEREDRES
jgi:hypothetical protein